MPEKFDWEQCKKACSKNTYDYLKRHFRSPITEEEFVEFMQENRDKSKNPRRKTPSRLRKDYNYLKTKFGFFTN